MFDHATKVMLRANRLACKLGRVCHASHVTITITKRPWTSWAFRDTSWEREWAGILA